MVEPNYAGASVNGEFSIAANLRPCQIVRLAGLFSVVTQEERTGAGSYLADLLWLKY